jgi:hypothetical protein
VEDEDGNIEEFTMQEEVHEAIWSNIHPKCFFLAEEAPICHSLLQKTFGYNADSLAGDEVLESSYVYENNFEEYTQANCHVVAQIWEVIPERSVDEIVWGGDWGKFWSPRLGGDIILRIWFAFWSLQDRHKFSGDLALPHDEGISDSEDWLWFGLMGARTVSDVGEGSRLSTDKKTQIDSSYGGRFQQHQQDPVQYTDAEHGALYGFMLDEIFSERSTAEEGTLLKVLFYDVVQQTRSAAGISSVDVDNCYDRVSHAIASLVFCSFGVSKEATGAC